jgi:hypothetical protein
MFGAKRAVFNLMRTPAKSLLLNGTARLSTQGLMAAQTQVRGFASFETIEKASQKLNKALEGEIKYENENYSQLEDIDTFLTESGFLFTEEDNGISMSLKKDVGDKSVEILFESR